MMETLCEKEVEVFKKVRTLRGGDGLDNAVSFEASAILGDESQNTPYAIRLETAEEIIDNYMAEKPSELLKTLNDYIKSKEFGKYAWELWSRVKERSINLKQLMQVITWLDGESYKYSIYQNEMEYQYHFPSEVRYICCRFAFMVLKKGLLEGWWNETNGLITDGFEEISLDQLGESHPKRKEEIINFDREKEDFILAPLDHCTQENALTVFCLIGI